MGLDGLGQVLNRRLHAHGGDHIADEISRMLSHDMGAQDFTVVCDRRRITLADPGGHAESIEWEDLTRVNIVTTDRGPFVCDVFFVLESDNAQLWTDGSHALDVTEGP